MCKRFLYLALTGLIIMGGTGTTTAVAQQLGRVELTETNSTSYYRYVQPGAPTVLVRVIGTVRSPGLYEVTQGTDLGQLLALSGGPTLAVRPGTNDRDVTIRLFRPDGLRTEPLYEQALQNSITKPDLYPLLMDNDVLSVEVVENQGFGWRDAVSIVGALGSLGFAIDLLTR